MKKHNKNIHHKRKKIKEKKNKNYEDTEESQEGIVYSLINDYHNNNFKKNFYIKSIRTDGNCLFRAVSDQLYNYEDNYKEIRKKVVDHLSKKEEEYKNFVEYDESYKSYIERISLDGTWGGQLELQAIGEIYKVNILIYQENGCILEIKNHSDEKKCIQLHYASSEHYNSVRFKNKALDNELKTISYLRGILNDKDENDSTKTFYETTENELTDSCESHNSINVKYKEKKNYENNNESFSYLMNNERKSDCKVNSEIGNDIDFLNDDKNELNSMDILQGIYKGIKNKNTRTRSRSMPNINEKFLYFFSQNKSSENIESDSTIDNLNEKRNIEKKKKINKKKKIIFLKFNSFNQEANDLKEYFSSNTVNENKIIRVYYNKLFYNYLYSSKSIKHNDRKLLFWNSNIYEKKGTVKKGYIPNCELKSNSNVLKKIENYEFLDIFSEKTKENKSISYKHINNNKCNLENNKNSDYTNDESIYESNSKSISNSIQKCKKKGEYFSSSSYMRIMDDNFASCNLANANISKDRKQLNEISTDNFFKENEKCINKKNEEIAKFTSKNLNTFDIIIGDYGICLDTDLFYSYISSKCFKKNNGHNISFLNKDNLDNHISDSFESHINLNSSKSSEDETAKMNNKNKKKLDNNALNINIRDLLIRRKYNSKKFVNMFSRDLFSKGLFHFLNADFTLNEDNIKYITQFFYHNKEINIFKNNFYKHDFYFCDNLMFYFTLNHEKLQKKIKYSKECYEEFIIKEKHKYNKFLKGNGTSRSNKKKEKKMKIISV